MFETATLDPLDLIDGVPTLGSPPAVYQRLVDVLDDPHVGAHEVAAVVGQDPSLTARLLRLANSAYFGFDRPVDSVHQAVSYIGLIHVRDLALATSVSESFRDVPADLIHLEDFWRHSLAVGICSRMLAGMRRETNVERFFIAGMLHDVGRLVLYVSAPDVARTVLEQARARECLLFQAEMELAGLDHGTIGGALLRKWNMSESLIESVGLHHRPQDARTYPIETATIHLADLIANALRLGRSGERRVPPRWIGVWDILGLDPAELPGLMESTRHEYDAVVGAFGLAAD